MYITNKNKVIFEFQMSCLSNDTDTAKTVATSTWGGLNFIDIFISQLLFSIDENVYHILSTYDQTLCGNQHFKRRNFDTVLDSENDLWGDAIIQDTERTTILEKTVSDTIKKQLTELDPYLAFLDACIDHFREDRRLTESFQRSFIYEFLFHHLINRNKNLIKSFIQARRQSILGFEAYEPSISFISNWYSKKYAYFIIPRRMGKTYVQELVIGLTACYFDNNKTLYVAHNKNLAESTRHNVEQVLYKEKLKKTDLIGRINTPVDCTEVIKRNDKISTVDYISGATSKASRGKTANLFCCDESANIPFLNIAAMMAHGTLSSCKMMFLSSSCADKVEMIKRIIFGLVSINDVINLYRVTFFCMDSNHLKHVKSQAACPRLHMYVPNHVILDTANAEITSVLTNCEKSYENELGILSERDLPRNAAKAGNIFSPELIKFLSFDPYALQAFTIETINEAFFYFDPSINSASSSANALCVVGKTSTGIPVLLYCDEISNNTGICMLDYSSIMSGMIIHAMNHIYESLVESSCFKRRCLETPQKLKYYLAVEANSQEIVASELYKMIRLYSRRVTDKFHIFFYYEGRLSKLPERKPGYWLLRQKTDTFRLAIQHLNDHKLFISIALGSRTSENIITTLVNQLKQFSYVSPKEGYTGKISKTSRDDIVDALILAVHLSNVFKDKLLNSYKGNVIEFGKNEPWIHSSLISDDGYVQFRAENVTKKNLR